MDNAALWSSWSDVGWTVAASIAIYFWILVALRLNGLRTLAAFSGYDVVVTVAIGSVVATTALSRSVSIVSGTVAIGVLVGCQRLLTEARRRTGVQPHVDNQPVLLMTRGRILHDNLAAVGVTVDDLRQKIRRAGAARFEQVETAVFETTGNVSIVLSSNGPIDPDLFRGVRDIGRHTGRSDAERPT